MDSIGSEIMKMLSSGDNLSAISNKVGGDQNAVKSAIGMSVPAIMGSMADKASQPGGTDMLSKMMGSMGSNNPADNVSATLNNPEASGGSNMVSNLLGGQMSTIQNTISKKTGLPADAVGKILAMVTPLVVGMVSKKFNPQSAGSQGLSAFLGDQSKMAMQSSPEVTAQLRQTGSEKKGGIMAKLKGLFGG